MLWSAYHCVRGNSCLCTLSAGAYIETYLHQPDFFLKSFYGTLLPPLHQKFTHNHTCTHKRTQPRMNTRHTHTHTHTHTHKISLTDCIICANTHSVNTTFNTSLKSPDFKEYFYNFVRTHDWLTGILCNKMRIQWHGHLHVYRDLMPQIRCSNISLGQTTSQWQG